MTELKYKMVSDSRSDDSSDFGLSNDQESKCDLNYKHIFIYFPASSILEY